ncbi:MAG: hypothetical protein QF402_03850, partial [Candidatus Latescibacteria bacterium]|nr:hypothetical protein [Candidatus Latescibacterota bacterium]
LYQRAAKSLGFQILFVFPNDACDGTELLDVESVLPFGVAMEDAIDIDVRIVVEWLTTAPSLS